MTHTNQKFLETHGICFCFSLFSFCAFLYCWHTKNSSRTESRHGPLGFSECETDPIESDSTPTSPKQLVPVEAIILVHGVQPELQITLEESKRDSKFLYAFITKQFLIFENGFRAADFCDQMSNRNKISRFLSPFLSVSICLSIP